MGEVYRIRDTTGSVVVDKDYITSNPDWFYLSSKWSIGDVTTYEYMNVRDEIIYVPAPWYKVILSMFKQQ